MRLIAWMAAGSVVSAVAAALATGGHATAEILLGMFGPLVETCATWVFAEVVYNRPEQRTKVMITAFASKLVFFGVYVTVMLIVLALRPVPFMTAFTTYFIALHLIEAMALRRLFEAGPRGSV